MRKGTINRIRLATALTIGFLYAATAATAVQPEGRAFIKELKDTIQSYTAKNIQPLLLQWKSKLENAMTKEDLAILIQLRAKKDAILKEQAEDMKQAFNETKSSEEADVKELRNKRNEIRSNSKEELKAIYKETASLADKYKETLGKIADESSGKKEEWRNDVEKIIKDWKEQHSSELSGAKQHKRMYQGIEEKTPGSMKFLPDRNKENSGVHFMLWDGKLSQDRQKISIRQSFSSRKRESSQGSPLSNAPNPFSEKTTIKFSLDEAQDVNLSIFDSNGKKVAELFDGELGEGEHSFVFNAAKYKSLPAGTYTYTITTQSGKQTGNMILAK